MIPAFFTNAIGEIAKKSVYTVLALFLIGGAQRLADYAHAEPVKQVLSIVDGVLIQQRSTIIANGTTVVVSDTASIPSSTVQVSGTLVQ